MKKIFIFLLGIMLFVSSREQTVGSKVSFTTVDGKPYTGTITDIQGANYKVKYDGFDFEAWLTNNQFNVVNTNTPTYTPVTQPQSTQWNTTNTAKVQDVYSIFNFGKRQGWASQIQETKFNNYLAQLSQQNKNKLIQFINQATTFSAKFFVLKSLLAGDNFTILQKLINQLNKYPESYQLEKCLITNHRSIIQQWEYSCSVTAVQTYLADLCPRYAWEVKQVSNYDVAADDPYNNPMGQQQKMLMEKYGGVATPRGDFSGKAIAIDNALNEFVGRILGVKFYFKQVNESLTTVFNKIRNMLDKGLDEPLLIGFVGSQAKHFILVMKYRNTGSGYQYLIYDPWDGVCDYVNESTILQGSLAPLLTQWRITVDYYYPTK